MRKNVVLTSDGASSTVISAMRDRRNAWSWLRFACTAAAFGCHVLALRNLAA